MQKTMKKVTRKGGMQRLARGIEAMQRGSQSAAPRGRRRR